MKAISKSIRRVVRRRGPAGNVERVEARTLFSAYIAGNPMAYGTIQAAVDAAAAGATINVMPGTYNEGVVITKPLTLLGAQAGVDARNTRGAESVVANPRTAIKVLASGVTIDGFTVQGTKANVGAALCAGIVLGPGIHGTHVFNNVIRNNVTGLYLANSSDTDAAVIRNNYFYNNTETGSAWNSGWNGSCAIYSDGEVSGGLLTNVLIDSNKFYRDDPHTGQAMIDFVASTAGKQFNVTVSRNTFASTTNSASKDMLVYNMTNLSFIGNDAAGTSDTESGPIRFEGNNHNINVQYNSLHDNLGPGTVIDASTADGTNAGFVVRNNNIYNNKTGNIGIIVSAGDYAGTFDATGNWWGSASGPSGQGPGSGQAVWGDGTTGHQTPPVGRVGSEIRFSGWATSQINIANVPAPASDTALSASSTSGGSVALSWTAPFSTAVNQTVQRSSDGVNFATIATVSPLLTSYTDATAGGQAYSYRVVAGNYAGTAAPSNIAAVGGTVTRQPPSSPTGLTVTGTTSTTASLAWAASTSSVGLSGYTVYRNGTSIGTATGTSFTDTGLTAGTAYSYTVVANDIQGGASAPSAAVAAQTAAATTGPVAPSSVQLADGSFEATRVTAGSYKGTPTTASWTFTGKSGIASNGNSLKSAAAPDGTQVAFLKANSAGAKLAQTLVTPAGTFTLSLSAANRPAYAVNPVVVSVDGVIVGTISPTTNAFATYATAGFALTAGSHTIAFAGTLTSGDAATFIDAVSLNTTAASAPVSGAITPLSTLDWTSATSGYGTVTKNLNASGGPLGIGGVNYASGIGTHASSTIVYNLAGGYTTFQSDLGFDSRSLGRPADAVYFQVVGDGKVLYDSGAFNDPSKVLSVSVDVTGVKTLTLVANAVVAGSIDYCHVDWANARLS